MAKSSELRVRSNNLGGAVSPGFLTNFYQTLCLESRRQHSTESPQ